MMMNVRELPGHLTPRLRHCLAAVILVSSTASIAAGRDWTDGLDLMYEASNRSKMPYRLYLPKDYDDSQEYPLVMYLHGLGGRGNDNASHLGSIGGLIDRTEVDYPAILLAPQLPRTGEPYNYWGYPEDLSPDIFRALQEEYSIDERRIYLTGASNGGQGVTWYAYGVPGAFRAAAIAPFAATFQMPPSVGEPISEVPTWLFHGDNDGSVLFNGPWGSRTYFSNVTGETPIVFDEVAYGYPTAVSGPIRYTELTGSGHGIWYGIYAHDDPALYDWMFSQSIPEPSILTAAATGDWNAVGTWDDGTQTPTADYDAVVGSHVVTISEDAVAKSLTITEADGKLVVDAGTVLDLTEWFTATIGSNVEIVVAGDSPGQINAGGNALVGDSNLHLTIDGADPFKAGTYSLVTSAGPTGMLGYFIPGRRLGAYVSQGTRGDGLARTWDRFSS